MIEQQPYQLYVKHFGTILCATLEDAQKIKTVWLRRQPKASVEEPIPVFFATFDTFTAYPRKD